MGEVGRKRLSWRDRESVDGAKRSVPTSNFKQKRWARRKRAFAHSTKLPPSLRERSDEAIHTFFAAMDCFAEPVIGRAFARPVGSQ
jgi:hypothetical protein